jgi:EAL domain-containing protein (putative c-di-GMP-specific phosphodiesterase class I)/CheY-like chemotaxis protein
MTGQHSYLCQDAVKSRDSDIPIAVLDDDPTLLEIIRHGLSRAGYTQIEIFTNGRDLLFEINNNKSYEIILLDLKMPDIDGIEIIRYLAKINYMGSIILLSGEDNHLISTARYFSEKSNIRIKGSLRKPFSCHSLISIMQSMHRSSNNSNNSYINSVSPFDLNFAIDNGYIKPYIQPKLNLKTQEVSSGEILARWEHFKYGFISPIQFIRMAEDNNLIDKLTWSILKQSLIFHTRLLEKIPEFSISINISNCSLKDIHFPEKLVELVSDYSIPHSLVILELTESSVIKDISITLDILIRLRLKGFQLSIDDFGTGYSSMSQLGRIPFTELKIDRSFIEGYEDLTSKSVIEASLQLANKLGLETVAEGIESYGQLSYVNSLNCKYAQGKLISMPMPLTDFINWRDYQFSLQKI